MPDDINQIQTEIQDIQAKIAALSPPPPTPALPPGTPTFAQALHQAQGASTTSLPAQPTQSPNGIQVPPASLGPLPSLPPLPVRVSSVGNYESLIQNAASQHGVSPSLVRAIIQTESGGDPKAVSSAGAMGLMQLMPSDAHEAGISDPFDPAQNIAAGTQQIAGYLQQYHGDLDLALAAYNAGPGNVRKYGGVPPFSETQNYIRKIHAAMQKGNG
jgi:soluble lytic murein transglycosylase-like protein